MKEFLYDYEELIPVIIMGIIMIGVGIFLNNKIEECHEKGGTYVRGYCVSSEVIK